MAELWMGAHPVSPSRLSADDKSLAVLIGENPEIALGSCSVSQFGLQLPFLFKILSAASPLSLQAHPGKRQAKEGFKKENSTGIPLAAPTRNYKDDNHKPEILLAITDFSALCGFRNVKETIELFDSLSLPQLTDSLQDLRRTGEYTPFFGFLLGLSHTDCANLISTLRPKLSSLDLNTLPNYAHKAFSLLEELIALFPNDAGVLAPLYLNIVDLAPGDALYLPEGILHSYIRGTGLELMANSDNVLRGGLTGKHIDKTELLSVLEPTPYVPKIICSRMDDGIQRYITPSPEFELSAIRKKTGVTQYSFIADGPSIILGEKGAIILRSETDSFTVSQGVTVFLPATGNSILIEGQGSCYRASLPWKGCPE
jgi:mannose-6-phosphate isomerase